MPERPFPFPERVKGVDLMQLMLIAVLAATTGGQSLEWSRHYANAKTQAAAEQRPLLVVVEDSTSPNGRFAVDQLASKKSHVDLLKKYRLCRMDINTAYGRRVAEAFDADTFPMTVITDKTTQYITFRAHGSMNPELWQRTLASRAAGANPSSAGSGSSANSQRIETQKIITDWPGSSISVQQNGGFSGRT